MAQAELHRFEQGVMEDFFLGKYEAVGVLVDWSSFLESKAMIKFLGGRRFSLTSEHNVGVF